jgi:hypothetical protein
VASWLVAVFDGSVNSVLIQQLGMLPQGLVVVYAEKRDRYTMFVCVNESFGLF